MRVVFLYVRDGDSPGQVYNPNVKSTNFYANRVKEEGYYYLLERMVETKIIHEALIFIESNKGQGYVNYPNPNIKGIVMPDINDLPYHIRPNDIIFCRGGWKTWYDPFLLQMKKDKHWMLLYAANTGREKWPVWDIVFNDLNGDNKVDVRDCLQFNFIKPTNPKSYFYIPETKMKYDLCIGASYIFNKKGQYKTINALLKYREIFNENPICIMPGSIRRDAKTTEAINLLKQEKLNVFMPGRVNAIKLNLIFNQSRFFIHLGGGGQGDRSPLEAMRCGASTIIGNTRRHSKVLYQDKKLCTVFDENMGDEEIARKLYYKIKTYDIKIRQKLYNYYEENAGVETVILPEMATLFDVFKKYPKQNMSEIRKVYT